MDLIKCPKCGKLDVPNSAITCPNCRFKIKEWSEKIREKEKIEAEIHNYRKEQDDMILNIKPVPKPSFIIEVILFGTFSPFTQLDIGIFFLTTLFVILCVFVWFVGTILSAITMTFMDNDILGYIVAFGIVIVLYLLLFAILTKEGIDRYKKIYKDYNDFEAYKAKRIQEINSYYQPKLELAQRKSDEIDKAIKQLIDSHVIKTNTSNSAIVQKSISSNVTHKNQSYQSHQNNYSYHHSRAYNTSITGPKAYTRVTHTTDHDMELADMSILKIHGYSVSKKDGLSEERRHEILAEIIDNYVLSKKEVIKYLDFFIAQRRGQPRYREAISKWENDREFVRGYFG